VATSLLYLIPRSAAHLLHGGQGMVVLLFCVTGAGLTVGGLLSDRLGVQKTEPGLIPVGAIGISIFMFILFWSSPTASSILAALQIITTFFILAMSCGLFVLPLYSFIQQQKGTHATHRLLCGHHLLNFLFAILAINLITAFFYLGVQSRWVFFSLAISNAIVAVFIYKVIPEFFFRFLCFTLSRIIYRLRVHGYSNLPKKGPAVLVCNHVTFVDWMIVAGACHRPVRFVMDQAFLNIPLTGRLFRDGKVIPITTGKKGPKLLKAASEKIAHELESGNIVCIFPEGKITKTGQLNLFKPGIELIIKTTPVPVIPMALNGLWGSFFSRKYGRAMSKPFKRFRSQISLAIGPPISPENVTASGLQQDVASLHQPHHFP